MWGSFGFVLFCFGFGVLFFFCSWSIFKAACVYTLYINPNNPVVKIISQQSLCLGMFFMHLWTAPIWVKNMTKNIMLNQFKTHRAVERGMLPWLLLLGHFFIFFLSKQYLGSEHPFMFQPVWSLLCTEILQLTFCLFKAFVSMLRDRRRCLEYELKYEMEFTWRVIDLCSFASLKFIRTAEMANWPPIHHTSC